TLCGFFGGGVGLGDGEGTAAALSATSFCPGICASFGIEFGAAVILPASPVGLFRLGTGIAALSVLAMTGEGEGAGFGGVYCSMITGVDIPRVGSRRSLADKEVVSIAYGSSCCSIKASTPIALTRSKSPGRAP